MATDLEKARVTELHVRMDCNGCVQRIKKAMHSIDGVYDVYVDLPQQKLTVVGRADPETLVKAIKKTRKIATICSHTEQQATTEPEASSSLPATDAANQPPSESPPAEATPPVEPPKDAAPQENPAPEDTKPLPVAQGPKTAESKDKEEVHMVCHYPRNHVTREHWKNYPPMGHEIRHEAPSYVTHSYNTYRPSPYVSEYGYIRSPPQEVRYHSVEAYGDGYYQNRGSEGYYQNREDYGDRYYQNRGSERYYQNREAYGEGYYQNRGSEGYHQNRGGEGNQITSIFSDENPNACRIV